MKPSERLQAAIVTTFLPVWDNGQVRTYLSAHSLTGAELAECLTQAIRHRDRVNLSIEAMAKALDNGETVGERKARIEMEDLDPETAAKALGWYSIGDFAKLCDQGENGFAKHIKGFIRERIVRPRSFEHVTGSNWPRYESSGFFWADHFDVAEDWADALKKARQTQTEALMQKYKGA
jgi:hypothetical protein